MFTTTFIGPIRKIFKQNLFIDRFSMILVLVIFKFGATIVSQIWEAFYKIRQRHIFSISTKNFRYKIKFIATKGKYEYLFRIIFLNTWYLVSVWNEKASQRLNLNIEGDFLEGEFIGKTKFNFFPSESWILTGARKVQNFL